MTITLAFIIPYRERIEHKHFFEMYMKYIVEDYDPSSYIILYIQQDDERSFNRGAMKNIGFLYVKQVYPEQYQNITLVFNDIDTVPYRKNLLDYETEEGQIKHFFGFTFALGGIFSIKGSDFEKIDGFPNYWQWGFEDNVIYKRSLENDIVVDRSNFYRVGCHKILHFCDAIQKVIDKDVLQTQFERNYKEEDGLSKLLNVKFEKKDNNVVHVTNFETFYNSHNKNLMKYSLANGTKIQTPNIRKQTLMFL
jgi:hypothetical protein